MFKTSFHQQKERRAREHFVKQFSLIINGEINPLFVIQPKEEVAVASDTQQTKTVDSTPPVTPVIAESTTVVNETNNESTENNILDIISEIEEKADDALMASEVPQEDMESIHIEEEVEDKTSSEEKIEEAVENSQPEVKEEIVEPTKETSTATKKVEEPKKETKQQPTVEQKAESKPNVEEFDDDLDDDNALSELLGNDNIVVDDDLEKILGDD